jgi:hypothetical protein
MAAAVPNSRKQIVEGGRLINLADSAVLRFLHELPR